MSSSTAIAESLGAKLELVARRTAGAAVMLWRPGGLWINAAGIAIRGGQAVAASVSRAHLAALAAAGGAGDLPPGVQAPEAIGVLSAGTIVERALVVTAGRIRAAPTPELAARAARLGIARVAHTAALDAGRAELHAGILAGPFTGWRWFSRGTCAACLVADNGSDRPEGSAMHTHPGCVCVAEPILKPVKLDTDKLEAEFPDVALDISETDEILTLSRIVVPKGDRNAGVGTRILERITAHADATGKTVALTPATDFGGTLSGLRRFYARHGFVKNAGRVKDFRTREAMIRIPVERATGLERFEAMSAAEQDAAIGAEAAAAVRAGDVKLTELVGREEIHGERVIVQEPLGDAAAG